MRVFDHPNMTDFKCPICGTGEDRPVVLVGISGTEKKRIMEAKQFHIDCIDLVYFPEINGLPNLIAQTWEAR